MLFRVFFYVEKQRIRPIRRIVLTIPYQIGNNILRVVAFLIPLDDQANKRLFSHLFIYL